MCDVQLIVHCFNEVRARCQLILGRIIATAFFAIICVMSVSVCVYLHFYLYL